METARKIAEITGLPLIEVISRALSAGLKAIQDNGYAITFPLKFEIVEPEKFMRDRNYPQVRDEGMVVEDRDQPPKKKGKK